MLVFGLIKVKHEFNFMLRSVLNLKQHYLDKPSIVWAVACT